MPIYLVDKKIVRAYSDRHACRVANDPDYSLCCVIELKDDLPNRVLVDLDDSIPVNLLTED